MAPPYKYQFTLSQTSLSRTSFRTFSQHKVQINAKLDIRPVEEVGPVATNVSICAP